MSKPSLFSITLTFLLPLSLCSNFSTSDFRINVTVSQDGSGNFSEIGDALKVSPNYSFRAFVIFVKKGVYQEYVTVEETKWNIVMIGEGMDSTIITGDRSNGSGWSTMNSATFAVHGKGFIAMKLGFQNTAGPDKHQAVAYLSDSDYSALYNCSFMGYQDTLYLRHYSHFFRECKISGTVDFIFGDAAAVFQYCDIMLRKGLPGQKNVISAQGRIGDEDPSGFSFQYCNIFADSDLIGYLNSTFSYLGRPWRPYSRTVFMQSYMSGVISPQGWLEFSGSYGLDTLYYAEYMNHGPGASTGGRVKWPGYQVLNDTAEAEVYTVAKFISGNSWLPATGVPYVAGLS